MVPVMGAAETAMAIARERLIAACRVLIAAAALVAMWFDPTEPARLPEVAMALATAYALYALALAAALQSPRRGLLAPRLQLVLHIVDVSAFALLALVTDGASSPYVLAFVFVVAAAAVRWQLRGTLWTAAAALALLVLFAGLASFTTLGDDSSPERMLVRAVLLLVIALLVGYLAVSDIGLRARILSLVSWPTASSSDVGQELPRMLEHAGRALGAAALVAVWEDPEEPLCNVVQWTPDGLDWDHEEAQQVAAPEDPSLLPAAFAVTPGGRRFRILVEGRARLVEDDPLPAWLRARTGAASAALSVPLRGETLSGRLDALGVARADADGLALALLLAERLARSLDQLELFERFHRQGLRRERTRLARDLHDGVIQSLAAANVRLEAAAQRMRQSPSDAALLIAQVQELLGSEQRELRASLGELESAPGDAAGATDPERRLAWPERLPELVARIGRHWNIAVDLRDGLSAAPLPRGLDHEVDCLVLEALVNASRHGAARHARVELARADGQVRIRVSDDGRGFGFEGRRSCDGERADGQEPASIRRRVDALGGSLALESGPAGAMVDIRLPHRPLDRLA